MTANRRQRARLRRYHQQQCPAEGVDDPTADSFTAESASAEEVPAEPEATPEPTPEPTPVPEYEGLSVQPTTYYNEGEQPTYTVTDGNNLNMRGGPAPTMTRSVRCPLPPA